MYSMYIFKCMYDCGTTLNNLSKFVVAPISAIVPLDAAIDEVNYSRADVCEVWLSPLLDAHSMITLTNICINTYIRTFMHTNCNTCIHTYVHSYILYIQSVNTYMHTHTYVHSYIHT